MKQPKTFRANPKLWKLIQQVKLDLGIDLQDYIEKALVNQLRADGYEGKLKKLGYK